MNSIFSKIYKYKQTEKQNQIENYLTEIFAHCLKADEVLRNDFFKEIGLEPIGDVKIVTQKTFFDGKRPDICITADNCFLLIECKVGADEGHNQLLHYRQILEKSEKNNTKLIFLTKYIHKKSEADINITWSDIAEMIKDNNNLLTNELKEYLFDNNIAFMEKFTEKNKNSLKHIRETIQKMELVLDSIRKDSDFNFSPKSRKDKLTTHSAFYDKVKLPDDVILDIGFFGFNTKEITYGVRFFSENDDAILKLEKYFDNVSGWIKNHVWVGKYELLEDETKNINSVSFINTALEEVKKYLKNK